MRLSIIKLKYVANLRLHLLTLKNSAEKWDCFIYALNSEKESDYFTFVPL